MLCILSNLVLMSLCRYSRFQSVANLTLHFPENFGGDTAQIYYIGLRGEATQVFSHKYHMGTSFLFELVC